MNSQLKVMLLNEMQKQYRRAKAEATMMQQEDRVEALQKQNEEFQRWLSRLEAVAGQPANAAAGRGPWGQLSNRDPVVLPNLLPNKCRLLTVQPRLR